MRFLIGLMIGVCAGMATLQAGLSLAGAGTLRNALAFAVAALIWLALAALASRPSTSQES